MHIARIARCHTGLNSPGTLEPWHMLGCLGHTPVSKAHSVRLRLRLAEEPLREVLELFAPSSARFCHFMAVDPPSAKYNNLVAKATLKELSA